MKIELKIISDNGTVLLYREGNAKDRWRYDLSKSFVIDPDGDDLKASNVNAGGEDL